MRAFVKEQHDRLRDERLAKHEESHIKEQCQHELLLKAREKDAQEGKREIEKEPEEKAHEFELQRKREARDTEIKLKEQDRVPREREFKHQREREEKA